MGLFDAIKNLFGEKSEREAEEIIQLANDPEGDEWNDQFPITPHPGTDTPDEIEAVNPPDPPEDKGGGGFSVSSLEDEWNQGVSASSGIDRQRIINCLR